MKIIKIINNIKFNSKGGGIMAFVKFYKMMMKQIKKHK